MSHSLHHNNKYNFRCDVVSSLNIKTDVPCAK